MQSRENSLMPNNVPRYVRCYDNGGDTVDRYTIIFTRKTYKGYSQFVGSSSNPYHYQGIYYHDEFYGFIDKPSYKHLGKKIKFKTLPKDCQTAVIQDYKEIWNLN